VQKKKKNVGVEENAICRRESANMVSIGLQQAREGEGR